MEAAGKLFMVLLPRISSSGEQLSFQLEPCHATPVTVQQFGNPTGCPPARLRLGDDSAGVCRVGARASGALRGRAGALHLPVLLHGGTG